MTRISDQMTIRNQTDELTKGALSMRNIFFVICASLFLFGCGERTGNPNNADIPASQWHASIQNVQALVNAQCTVVVTIEYIESIAPPIPSPIDEKALVNKICANPPK